MADFDLMVTWRRSDDSTVDLPATVCYRDDVDTPERRAEAITHAIEANVIDFPDDLDEDAVPVTVKFTS